MSWTLAGGDAPSGNSNTDGYKVTAKTMFLTLPSSSQANAMGGPCVQYLNSSGAAMATTDTAQGAPVICHFTYFSGTSAATHATTAQRLYLWTHAQWGAGTVPTATFAAPGTSVVVATYGVVFAPVNGASTVLGVQSV